MIHVGGRIGLEWGNMYKDAQLTLKTAKTAIVLKSNYSCRFEHLPCIAHKHVIGRASLLGLLFLPTSCGLDTSHHHCRLGCDIAVEVRPALLGALHFLYP